MNSQKYTTKDFILFIGAIAILVFAGFVMMRILPMYFVKEAPVVPSVAPTIPIATTPPIKEPITTAVVKSEDIQTSPYSRLTLKTTNPLKELSEDIGAENVDAVLRFNRIDSQYIVQGSVLTIPKDISDFMALSPFPSELYLAQPIPKLLMISQRVQAFGVYENGVLVRWGPVSTGKESTPTDDRLYFTNWKGKLIHSSFEDEWILKWNFNLDNSAGIGMHQYELPGFPASHSCIRLSEVDAEWLYNWADQWIVSSDQKILLANGTPVIIFGHYDYSQRAPWKNLGKDSTATTISKDELETALTPNIDTINKAFTQREAVAHNMQ